MAHKIVLKIEPAAISIEPRAHRVIRHRAYSRRDAQRAAEIRGDGGESVAGAQSARSLNVNGQIAVPQAKPRLAPERGERRHEGPGFVASSPAALRIIEARKRIHDGVNVG